jgi:hypothetical protein
MSEREIWLGWIEGNKKEDKPKITMDAELGGLQWL